MRQAVTLDMKPLSEFKQGEEFRLWVNHGYRTAVPLLATKDFALVEYKLPSGSHLRFFPTAPSGGAGFLMYRNVSYKNLPLCLLRMLVEDNISWGHWLDHAEMLSRRKKEA